MDPFSVAASIAGILTLSGDIIQVLYSFGKNAFEAQESVNRVLSEIEIVRAVFSEIQRFLQDDFGEVDATRLTLIQIHKTLLDGCEAIFTKLKKHIIDEEGKPTMWERVIWAAKESEIEGLMRDLQRHKSSLDLILGIMNM
jgi:hypothetical protein